jgi:outer membrane protein OmpA-like peptidoglycan-associated protein
MNYLENLFYKASSLTLLAFCFSTTLDAQGIKSLSGVNTPQDDMNPVWIGDNTLLFSRAFHPDNIGGISDSGDIWMTQKSDSGDWLPAVHRADLSTDGYDFALGLEDLLTLLVYHSGGEKFGIFQYSKFGKDWNFLRKVNMPDIDKLSGQITGRVVLGGDVIFLSGEAADSEGNEDIYVSEKLGTIDWSTPENVGLTVNSKGQEMSPFYDLQSKRLFFSSNMQEGTQGKDILIAKKLGNTWMSWSKPVIWTQLSSAGSEVSVTFINEDEVVWTSTQNSDGFADLLTFDQPVQLVIPAEFETADFIAEQNTPTSPKTEAVKTEDLTSPAVAAGGVPMIASQTKIDEEPIQWFVVDAKNKKLVQFSLLWKQDGNQHELAGSSILLSSELNKEGVKEIKVTSPGYFPQVVLLNDIQVWQPTVVLMTKAESGNIVLLDKVNFKRGTSELEGEDTKASLSELASFLKENPDLKLRIHGHTDNAGDPSLNKALSLQRAGSVRDFLVEQGASFENIRISGWGGTRPFASNATEAGKAKNRRVELEVEQ